MSVCLGCRNLGKGFEVSSPANLESKAMSGHDGGKGGALLIDGKCPQSGNFSYGIGPSGRTLDKLST